MGKLYFKNRNQQGKSNCISPQASEDSLHVGKGTLQVLYFDATLNHVT